MKMRGFNISPNFIPLYLFHRVKIPAKYLFFLVGTQRMLWRTMHLRQKTSDCMISISTELVLSIHELIIWEPKKKKKNKKLYNVIKNLLVMNKIQYQKKCRNQFLAFATQSLLSCNLKIGTHKHISCIWMEIFYNTFKKELQVNQGKDWLVGDEHPPFVQTKAINGCQYNHSQGKDSKPA